MPNLKAGLNQAKWEKIRIPDCSVRSMYTFIPMDALPTMIKIHLISHDIGNYPELGLSYQINNRLASLADAISMDRSKIWFVSEYMRNYIGVRLNLGISVLAIIRHLKKANETINIDINHRIFDHVEWFNRVLLSIESGINNRVKRSRYIQTKSEIHTVKIPSLNQTGFDWTWGSLGLAPGKNNTIPPAKIQSLFNEDEERIIKACQIILERKMPNPLIVKPITLQSLLYYGYYGLLD